MRKTIKKFMNNLNKTFHIIKKLYVFTYILFKIFSILLFILISFYIFMTNQMESKNRDPKKKVLYFFF